MGNENKKNPAENPLWKQLDFGSRTMQYNLDVQTTRRSDAANTEKKKVDLKTWIERATGSGKNYWSYEGSTTYDPCTSKVRWIVCEDVQDITAAQLGDLKAK